MLQVLNVAEKFVLTDLVEAGYEMIAANHEKFMNIQVCLVCLGMC